MEDTRSIAQVISSISRRQRRNIILLGVAVVLQLQLVVLAGVNLAHRSQKGGGQEEARQEASAESEVEKEAEEEEEEQAKKVKPTPSPMEVNEKKLAEQMLSNTLMNPIDDAFNAPPSRGAR